MKTIAAAIVASLFAVAPATAAPKTAPSPASTDRAVQLQAPTNAATRYCYKTEMTGSRILSKVCKTRADWKNVGVIVPAGL
ncbi:hypothetical protein ASE95_05205 [Sphingomonas sp. Leaf231]|uniref:hypothetical protein n=1 Tax=Sphingomonas sp. Leaf231 TaxID=1736301 RepID=UPI0006FA1615|nr:hypothetical protein [Sphingomonas sp. Leaf231]KQN94244.1 hypothetical protein ASE95_05205 [Sphingomonas sp. Leaf231]